MMVTATPLIAIALATADVHFVAPTELPTLEDKADPDDGDAPLDDPDSDSEPADYEPPDPDLADPEANAPAEREVGASEVPAPPAPSNLKATGSAKPPPAKEAIERESAVDLDDKTKGKWKRSGSPQRFAFELKLGPYLPDVDRKWSGAGPGPYKTIFGRTDSQGNVTKDPLPGVMTALAFEWQFIYLAGPFLLGTQIAYFRDSARAPFAQPEPGQNTRSAADKVTFEMFPISLLLGYRFELLADRYKVPLIPYAKAGLTYAFWWTRDGNRKIATNTVGQKGRGGVWGWQVNPGLMLRLDFIEPGTAKKLDQSTGINHTYLFGELQYARIDNFGVGSAIELGDLTGFAGLGMEF
jgi:hypothetical protein